MNDHITFTERIDIQKISDLYEKVTSEIGKVIVGQQEMIDFILTAMLAGGHVLLEGVPGIAKTLTAKLFSRAAALKFSRIQFTPDLMPSDIIGTDIFNDASAAFEFKKGPIFSQIVLIDEINRAPAKTQSALFEVMEERQITAGRKTYLLAEPFIVLATQNPIEYEGTYRLPEAQLDRFLFKIEIPYPGFDEEVEVLSRAQERNDADILSQIKKVLSARELISARSIIKSVHIEQNLLEYITDIVHRSRKHPAVYLGGSPRASLAILDASRSYAALKGRDFVTPEDIQAVVPPALIHRILVTPEKEMEGKSSHDIIQEILKESKVPR